MRTKDFNSSPEKSRRPARDVIDAVLENMRQNLEPLKYSTLAPSRYVVYLHPAEYARLEGIIGILREQTVRALSEELGALNRQSTLKQYARKLLAGRGQDVRVENPAQWSVEFFPNADGDMPEGDILVDSELLLPADLELGIGERTRLVTTLRSGQGTTAKGRTVTDRVSPAGAAPAAMLEYEDASGRHSIEIRSTVTIGRGGNAYPVDIKIVSSADVSRHHARIRLDERNGRFVLIDLSSLGTTLDGRHIPHGADAETALPERARIGLADTVFLDFRMVRS